MAFPMFRRRFNESDKGILLGSDIAQVRQGVPVVPEGYLFPDITVRCIETWEAERSGGPAPSGCVIWSKKLPGSVRISVFEAG